MSFNETEIVVNGNPIKINISDELEITDISDDMDKVASQMAYWGSVWASAEQESAASDAYYRRWRATVGRKIAKDDPKLAEWKVRQLIEESSDFHSIKNDLSKALENVIHAKTMYEAFRVKANMLQSKGAMMRHELDSTSMRTTTNSTNRVEEKERKRAEGKAAMKKIFKSKKNNR
jgi:hypothetical protein